MLSSFTSPSKIMQQQQQQQRPIGTTIGSQSGQGAAAGGGGVVGVRSSGGSPPSYILPMPPLAPLSPYRPSPRKGPSNNSNNKWTRQLIEAVNSGSNYMSNDDLPVPIVLPVRVRSKHSDNDSSIIHDGQDKDYSLASSPLAPKSRIPQHLFILPVMLLEFMAISITRAVLPSMILNIFEDRVYLIMGCAECIRGLLAFVACPLFGKVSDAIGRRVCLLVTVMGTCAPVCSLALMSYDFHHYYTTLTTNPFGHDAQQQSQQKYSYSTPSSKRIWIFVYLLAFSGIFSSTFTLVFAYISDVVPRHQDRVTAYGLALATFGLSFTIGPMAGGYLARVEHDGSAGNISDEFSSRSSSSNIHGALVTGGVPTGEQEEEAIISATTLQVEMFNKNSDNILPSSSSSSAIAPNESAPDGYASHDDNKNHWTMAYAVVDPLGQQRVFTCALILTILDLLYIYFILPESRRVSTSNELRQRHDIEDYYREENDDHDDHVTVESNTRSLQERMEAWKQEYLPQSWTPLDALRIFSGDPFLAEVGRIAFLYYTGLWAVISTLVIYAAKHFHYGPERLGELMSAFGLCTMLSEAVLLRIIVPIMGEKRTMKLGLASFALQCIILGLAYDGWQLFVCVGLSMMSNLVYPSLTSLVSQAVRPDAVGEALGAVNGVKALTEGIGPLLFGGLMTISEKSQLPGWPYLLAACFAILAYRRTQYLPDEDDDDSAYVNEKYDYQNPFRMSSGCDTNSTRVGAGKRTVSDTLMSWLDGGPRLPSRRRGKSTSRNGEGVQAILDSSHDDTTYLGEERHGLLSDVDSNDYDDEDLDSNQGLELLHHGSGPAVSVSEENIEKNMQSGDATNRQNLQEMSVFEATKS